MLLLLPGRREMVINAFVALPSSVVAIGTTLPMPGCLQATSTTGRPTLMTTLGSAASGNFSANGGLAGATSVSGLARATTITDQLPCFRAQDLEQNTGLYQEKSTGRALFCRAQKLFTLGEPSPCSQKGISKRIAGRSAD